MKTKWAYMLEIMKLMMMDCFSGKIYSKESVNWHKLNCTTDCRIFFESIKTLLVMELKYTLPSSIKPTI